MSKGNRLSFWFFHALYIFNALVFKSETFENRLWQCIKVELFFVDGACQHSGYCCQHMMLFNGETPVDTDAALAALQQKDMSYNRFFPLQRKSDRILYYGCACLMSNNHCADYENRPSLCRIYPFNRFYQEDVIRKGCGYFVSPTQLQDVWLWPSLKERVDELRLKNGIMGR